MIDHNKSLLTISGKVAVGVARDSRFFFKASIYRAHRAVIFAIARLSGQLYYTRLICYVNRLTVHIPVATAEVLPLANSRVTIT